MGIEWNRIQSDDVCDWRCLLCCYLVSATLMLLLFLFLSWCCFKLGVVEMPTATATTMPVIVGVVTWSSCCSFFDILWRRSIFVKDSFGGGFFFSFFFFYEYIYFFLQLCFIFILDLTLNLILLDLLQLINLQDFVQQWKDTESHLTANECWHDPSTPNINIDLWPSLFLSPPSPLLPCCHIPLSNPIISWINQSIISMWLCL